MRHAPEPNPVWAALLRPWIVGPVVAVLLLVASLLVFPDWPSGVGKVFATVGGSSDTTIGKSPAKAEEDISTKGFYVGVSPDRERPFDSRSADSPFSGKYAPLGTVTDDEGSTADSGVSLDGAASSDAGASGDVTVSDDASGLPSGTVDLTGQPVSAVDVTDAEPNLLDVSEASKTGASVAVYSGGAYEAHDAKNMALIVDIPGGTKSRVYYKWGVYSLFVGGRTFALSEPVRFVPREGSVLELSDYKDRSVSSSSIRYNAFLGDISVRYSSASKALWAVNELPVEDYLKGMAEADEKGATEYLKTMAVVARSYAMYYLVAGGKHRGEPFDLHNSRLGNGNDQVYIGYNLGKRLKNMPKAIDATKGRVITYKGTVAKAPYFAGTDGRTRSAAQVFGPNSALPYCKSVKDPYGVIKNPITMPGNHMVGLSGAGARGYAKNGKDYAFILKHYYTGIGLDTVQPSRSIRIGIYKVTG